MTPELPGALARLAPLLEHYGYAAVFLLVLLDNCLVPVPGQTLLIAAAVYAGAGSLNLAAVVAVAVLGAVVGDTLGYVIGRTGGRAFIHRYGRYVLLPPDRFASVEAFFTRNGGKVVLFSRFIDGLRQTSGALAGITGMRWHRFAAYNVAGAVLWVGVWAGLGYSTGTHIGAVYTEVIRYQFYVLALLVAGVAVLVTRRVLRRRRAGRDGPADAPKTAPKTD
ncbi:DedA family protein [Streptacidiphilus sp. PB12-B1b]|uniref:DedA family protein n=1 Tax=Streptacidiphilus sp. PB12-B1b TaxID=2705012 RepID=UPI0015FD18DD|nr:DedA family protein [Streptacidiphilus sp. PB12-B1b]QMU77059.1 DedA family protein [Streptacidiphilus sp. PB12-B1b]